MTTDAGTHSRAPTPKDTSDPERRPFLSPEAETTHEAVMNRMNSDDANEAGWAATRGAVTGAARWGVVAAALGGIGYFASPMYRGFTIQFKVYIQMSAMAVGSMIEADSSLRRYEAQMRLQRRIERDRATWAQYEAEFDEPPKK